MPSLEIGLITLVILLTAFGQVLLKSAAHKYAGAILNARVFTAYAMFVTTVILSFYLMKMVPLKVFAVVMSLNYVAVALLAPIFLQEQMSTRKWIGTILVGAGVWIFSSGN